MAKDVLPEWIGACDDEPHWVPDRLQHRSQQDCYVIAITRAQFQHALRRMEHFYTEGILGVAYVLLHPLEQRLDLPQIVFGSDCSLEKDVDSCLADMEIFCPLFDQVADMLDRL